MIIGLQEAVNCDYIFTLYSMGTGAVFHYLQQIEQRIEDEDAALASAKLSEEKENLSADDGEDRR